MEKYPSVRIKKNKKPHTNKRHIRYRRIKVTVQVRRQWAPFLKHGKENTQPIVIYPAKIPLKKMKYFYRHTKVERIYHQLTTITGNVKWNPSGRRKIIPDENLNQHKGMKVIRKGKHEYKYKKLIVFKNVFKWII